MSASRSRARRTSSGDRAMPDRQYGPSPQPSTMRFRQRMRLAGRSRFSYSWAQPCKPQGDGARSPSRLRSSAERDLFRESRSEAPEQPNLRPANRLRWKAWDISAVDLQPFVPEPHDGVGGDRDLRPIRGRETFAKDRFNLLAINHFGFRRESPSISRKATTQTAGHLFGPKSGTEQVFHFSNMTGIRRAFPKCRRPKA